MATLPYYSVFNMKEFTPNFVSRERCNESHAVVLNHFALPAYYVQDNRFRTSEVVRALVGIANIFKKINIKNEN